MAIIRFYGDLKQFGDKFRVTAQTGAEALRCLLLQLPKLKTHMMSDHYRVRINGHDMNEKEFSSSIHTQLPDNAVIHIIPRALGSKNGGVFSIIAGAVMIVAGAVITYVSAGSGSPVGAALISAGIGMMLGGAAMMLTKTPGTPDVSSGLNSKNTSFSSLDNTIAQGAAVPLCYGKMMIGSKVLSQGIETL